MKAITHPVRRQRKRECAHTRRAAGSEKACSHTTRTLESEKACAHARMHSVRRESRRACAHTRRGGIREKSCAHTNRKRGRARGHARMHAKERVGAAGRGGLGGGREGMQSDSVEGSRRACAHRRREAGAREQKYMRADMQRGRRGGGGERRKACTHAHNEEGSRRACTHTRREGGGEEGEEGGGGSMHECSQRREKTKEHERIQVKGGCRKKTSAHACTEKGRGGGRESTHSGGEREIMRAYTQTWGEQKKVHSCTQRGEAERRRGMGGKRESMRASHRGGRRGGCSEKSSTHADSEEGKRKRTRATGAREHTRIQIETGR